MESSPNNSVLPLIQWLIGGGFIASFIGFIINKYFRVRPKIIVSLVWGGSQQSYFGANRLQFVWTPKLVLHNDSIHKARRIKLISSENIELWKFPSKIPETIEADHKDEIFFEITKSEAQNVLMNICGESAVKNNQYSEAYLPIVIGKVKLIFAYDSDKDRTFYTTVDIEGMTSLNKFHWRKPKLSGQK